MLPRRLVIGLSVLMVLAVRLIVAAQRGFGRFRLYDNVPYDGRFTFARIQYARYGGWAADYPTMERNLTVILQDITSMRPHVTGSNIHTFDDPKLMKYPVAYLSEPGYWFPNEAEVLGLRDYLGCLQESRQRADCQMIAWPERLYRRRAAQAASQATQQAGHHTEKRVQ